MAFGVELPEESNLRLAAEACLRERTAPATRGWPVGADALSLLYQLASQPERASDALKLLHELQVHQVELDLQYSEFSEREARLENDLQSYRTAFEFAPVAYCLIGEDGVVQEANLACADLLHEDAEALKGRSLASLVTESSRSVVLDHLKTLATEASAPPCEVELANQRQRTVQRLQGTIAPIDHSPIMVIIT